MTKVITKFIKHVYSFTIHKTLFFQDIPKNLTDLSMLAEATNVAL